MEQVAEKTGFIGCGTREHSSASKLQTDDLRNAPALAWREIHGAGLECRGAVQYFSSSRLDGIQVRVLAHFALELLAVAFVEK